VGSRIGGSNDELGDVFLTYTAQGAVHQDILHGYGSKGDCQLEAKVFERRLDLIKWECVRDVLPVMATRGATGEPAAAISEKKRPPREQVARSLRRSGTFAHTQSLSPL
jgi:hypothetical protein